MPCRGGFSNRIWYGRKSLRTSIVSMITKERSKGRVHAVKEYWSVGSVFKPVQKARKVSTTELDPFPL